MHNYHTHLNDYLRYSQGRYSGNIALITREESFTYSQIFHYVEKLALHFDYLGLKKGDRILISTGNSAFSLIAFWAALKIGVIVSIIHPKTSAHHYRYIIKDANPSLLICLSDQKKIAFGIEPLICLTDTFLTHAFFDTLPQDKNLKSTSILDVDLACIIYTSGSTGEPKGVVLSHRNMLSASISIQSYLQYQVRDRILCALPISFDYGLYQMILAFSVGASLILEPDFQLPLQVVKIIAEKEVSILPLVPSMVPILNAYYRRFSHDFSSVRLITNTGAALNAKHVKMLNDIFPSANIFSMYGLTECKRCTYLPPDKLQEKPNSVGVPIPNSELWVEDKNGSRLKANEIGEIVIRGAAVMQGYWNKPEKTAEKLRPGPWPGERILYTGDYGWLDEEGFLYLHGRADEIVKSRGVKVSPLEIEAILLQMPGIKEAAVIGLEDELLGSTLSAWLKTDGETTLEKIKAFCRAHLPSEKIPHSFQIVPHLPKNANGKIDKAFIRYHLIQNRVYA